MNGLSRFLATVAILAAGTSVQAEVILQPMEGDLSNVYHYLFWDSGIEGRFYAMSPDYVIFPDSRCSVQQAHHLLIEMHIDSLISKYSGRIYFFNPLSDNYDVEKDFDQYVHLMNHIRTTANLKIIGIGRGATFVNRAIASHAGNVAGIVTIGGRPAQIKGGSPVPVYVAGKNAEAVALNYKKLNAGHPLYKVEMDLRRDASLGEIIDSSWERLLSWNYRYNNLGHTWYVGEDFESHGDYEILPYVMPERMGLNRNVMVEDVCGNGEKYLWYEYIPTEIGNKGYASVPLVVLLHGHGNDPRTQAETSGFLSIAERERFAVVEMEWQGSKDFPAMHLDGIEATVRHLLEKYPQLDPSRIYACGLSAGAITATSLGIRKSHMFAAVGAQSAGMWPDYFFGPTSQMLTDEAIQKAGSVDTPYFSVLGLADDVVPFKSDNLPTNSYLSAWKAYEIMNNLPITDLLDFDAHPVFGVRLTRVHDFVSNQGISYHSGDMEKDGVPYVRIVAVDNYGHWNFYPGSEMMWEYFTHFSRDSKSKVLRYFP